MCFMCYTAKTAKQHASRVEQFEKRMCTQLKERQKVFEAAFMEQMKNYRELGRVPGKFHCNNNNNNKNKFCGTRICPIAARYVMLL